MARSIRRYILMASVLASLAALATVSCTRVLNPQRWVADRFLDRYVIEADPARALDLTTGRAHELLMQEIVSATDKGTRPAKGPKVNCTRLEERTEGEVTLLRYSVDVMSDVYSAFQRTVDIRVRKVDGRWKVSDFTFTS